MIKVLKVIKKFDVEGLKKAFLEASLTPTLKAGYEVQRKAKSSMRKGVRAKPSKPGHPPHRITGKLATNIHVAVAKHMGRRKNVVIVGPTSFGWYGKIHEWGGKHHPARPFMRPALAKVKAKMPQYFKGLKLGHTPTGRLMNAQNRIKR